VYDLVNPTLFVRVLFSGGVERVLGYGLLSREYEEG